MILALSPKNKNYSDLIRKYPGIINNSIILWIKDWSEIAL